MHTDAPDFQALFESAPGLYLVLDASLCIRAVSDAYLAATMTRRGEILGRNIFDVFPDNPDDPAATGVSNLRASLERVLREGVPDAMAVQKYDVRRPAEEGSGFEERYWSPLNSPVLDEAGAVRYIIHRVEDVTEFIRLKRHGAEQARASAELRDRAERSEAEVFLRAQQVQEANRSLTAANQELARLYERTRELDELKTRFFANVSHELRTPLTLILGPVRKHLESGRCPADVAHDLQVVERSARLLLTHVNDLLDLSKLEAGRMHVDYAEVDLASLSRQVASHFESFATERNLGYECRAPESLAAQVDPEKVQRILFNLLSNALKFTPGGGRVQLSLRLEAADVVFEVADTGPGIPADQRQAVFERFRQMDDPKRARGGTGLGLAIVKEFAELHGGSVELRDAVDGGALFVVRLPVRAPAGAPVRAAAEMIATPGGLIAPAELTRAPDRPPQVEALAADDAPLLLIVEDNPDMRAFLVDGLRSRYRVATAVDGQDGLEKALSLRPDLIVSDMMMPRMSGDEMAAELQRHVQVREIPIIFLTARTDDVLRVRALELGAQDYMGKPFSMPELLARVERRTTDRRRAQETLRQAHKLESVGRLASGIAHDFNNLLTAIMGYAHLIIDDPALTQAHAERARGINAACERASALTHQLLAFARKQPVALKVFDVNEMVRSAEPLLRRLIRDDIAIVLKLDAAIPTTRADRGQIEQVLINLAANARDAMPGPGTLTLATQNRADAGNATSPPAEFVVLIVSDTGVGMDESVRTRLFEPFFTTKEIGRGTGLGLASSYGIVQQIGGRIEVRSRPGFGSSFEVFLPVCRESSHAEAPQPPARAIPQSGAKILLAEDDPMVRGLLLMTLRGAGYDVLEARNGREALTLAEEHPARVDLLVSDALMPELNGRELAARIRRKRPDLRVLFISGYSDEVVRLETAQEPGTFYLPKPFSPQVLVERVRTVLA